MATSSEMPPIGAPLESAIAPPSAEPAPRRHPSRHARALPFSLPTALAPMQGAGHPLFRECIAEKGGVGLLCTEFVRVSRGPLNPALLHRAVVKSHGLPLSVQVMGNDATKMAEAAAAVEVAGADIVDINLGCPMPRVVRKGVGAAMLRDRVVLAEVVFAMRQAVKGTLSAKIRAGFDDADHVLEIADVLARCGVDLLTVHARRRRDFYAGVADWRIIADVVRHMDLPVIGNGDVWYAADALRLQEETGCAAVMIGRPALRNPWIFAQIDDLRAGREPIEPDGRLLAEYVLDIARRYEEAFGARALGRLKELLRWITRAIADDASLQQALLHANELDDVRRIATEHLAAVPIARLDLDAHGRFRLERSGTVTTPIS